MDHEATDARWQQYYARVSAQPHRKLTAMALQALDPELSKTALDCGCGTGSDIAYLLEQGFDVHGFDVRQEPLDVCRQRFSGSPRLQLTQADFSDFCYSPVSFVIANSSLFFCPQPAFPQVWQTLVAALPVGGVFSGDLLGVHDSWVNSPDHDVSAFTASEVDELFAGFKIIYRHERDEQGKTALGRSKHWHMHTVIARKVTVQ